MKPFPARSAALLTAALLLAPAARAAVVTPEECEALWRLARRGEPEEAERRLRAHLRTDPANPDVLFQLARIEGDTGGDAEPLFEKALAGFAARGDVAREVMAHVVRSASHVRRGRNAEAEAALAEAERIAGGRPELGDWPAVQRGWLAFRKGDHATAYRLFTQVEGRIASSPPSALHAVCLSGLAAVAHETQRLDLSVTYLRRHAEVAHQIGDFYDEARARGNLVLGAFRLRAVGRMTDGEILPLAQQALSAAVGAKNQGSEARAHLYLGHLTSGGEGRAHYVRALELARKVDEAASVIGALRGLALSWLESEPRDPARAFRLIDEAAQRARGIRYYAALTEVTRAEMRWQSGPREAAMASSLSALEAVETIRNLQDTAGVRARVFSQWTFVYRRLAGRLLVGPAPSVDDLEQAFAVSERMRARVLLDELDAAQASARLVPKGPAAEKHAEVLRGIAAVQRELAAPATTGEARGRAVRKLESLEQEEEHRRAELARAAPGLAALGATRLVGLAELRQQLAADEAVMTFQVAGRIGLDNRVTENGSWAWVHTRSGSRAFVIPDRETLRGKVMLFRGLVDRRDGSEREAAVLLYRELLEAPLRELPPGVRRLLFVPDSVLHFLPFEALRPAAEAEPVGLRYETAYAPSATFWSRLRTTAVEPLPRVALLLADPDDGTASSPGRLPHAEREAREALRRLGGAGVLRAGGEATESFLKSQPLGEYGIAHFAVHAISDDEHPERSALLLAPGRAEDDGLLQIREIVALDLRGKLVVLSACRGAAGELMEGEGLMGLARAFFQAGARAVVGSRWPVRDTEARVVIGSLYRELAAGRTVAASLAAARGEGRRAGVPAAQWAAFVVLGDGDTRLAASRGLRPADGFRLAAVVMAVAVVLAVSRFLYSRHRRAQ